MKVHGLTIHSLSDAQASCKCGRWSITCTGELTLEKITEAYQRHLANERNRNKRERHAALTGLGLKRVKGALGGVYYE